MAKGTDLSSCEQVASVLSVQEGEDHRAPSNLNTETVRKSTLDFLFPGFDNQEHRTFGEGAAGQGFGVADKILRRLLSELR